jgi:hypothetical protein
MTATIETKNVQPAAEAQTKPTPPERLFWLNKPDDYWQLLDDVLRVVEIAHEWLAKCEIPDRPAERPRIAAPPILLDKINILIAKLPPDRASATRSEQELLMIQNKLVDIGRAAVDAGRPECFMSLPLTRDLQNKVGALWGIIGHACGLRDRQFDQWLREVTFAETGVADRDLARAKEIALAYGLTPSWLKELLSKKRTKKAAKAATVPEGTESDQEG